MDQEHIIPLDTPIGRALLISFNPVLFIDSSSWLEVFVLILSKPYVVCVCVARYKLQIITDDRGDICACAPTIILAAMSSSRST